MTTTPLSTVLSYAASGDYTVFPVSTDILADIITPVEALRILKAQSPQCYLLESIAGNEQWGRYTFLGYDPQLEITCSNGELTIGAEHVHTTNPAAHIRQLLANYRSPQLPDLPPFTGGLVGYFSFDYLRYAEPQLGFDTPDPQGFHDVDLMLFDRVIAFDHFRQTITLIVNIPLDNPEENYTRALDELHTMVDLLRHGTPATTLTGTLRGPLTPEHTPEEFHDIVTQAQRYIHEGDIFQVVLSTCQSAPFDGSLFDTYRVLRTINPSLYMFYLSGNSIEIAGASPETLVKVERGTVHTFPIAGSRPRGATPAEDTALEEDLRTDPKELAEHNMLVDLGRNDLGRLCTFGSVKVKNYLSLLRFSHVMHLGSSISGTLAPGVDALDALAASLPAGTLSGAPKIRACEIIAELEKSRRGLYGGAIGYLDFTGNMDVCIAIRVAYAINGTVFVRSGAGIVADSVPETEHQETINKAAAIVSAIERAQEGNL